eukprot:7972819-Pyramimonas_sp.AAC.1
MQEFKARTLAIKDGGRHAAQWLALVPMDAGPCAASRLEETAARRVAHAELKREELRAKLHLMRSSF